MKKTSEKETTGQILGFITRDRNPADSALRTYGFEANDKAISLAVARGAFVPDFTMVAVVDPGERELPTWILAAGLMSLSRIYDERLVYAVASLLVAFPPCRHDAAQLKTHCLRHRSFYILREVAYYANRERLEAGIWCPLAMSLDEIYHALPMSDYTRSRVPRLREFIHEEMLRDHPRKA